VGVSASHSLLSNGKPGGVEAPADIVDVDLSSVNDDKADHPDHRLVVGADSCTKPIRAKDTTDNPGDVTTDCAQACDDHLESACAQPINIADDDAPRYSRSVATSWYCERNIFVQLVVLSNTAALGISPVLPVKRKPPDRPSINDFVFMGVSQPVESLTAPYEPITFKQPLKYVDREPATVYSLQLNHSAVRVGVSDNVLASPLLIVDRVPPDKFTDQIMTVHAFNIARSSTHHEFPVRPVRTSKRMCLSTNFYFP
jgi:hypothetical protein